MSIIASIPREQLYPLGVQCGRAAWQRLGVDSELSEADPKALFRLREKTAEDLRASAADPLSAGELRQWGVLNHALQLLGRLYLEQNPPEVLTTARYFSQLLADQLELFPVAAWQRPNVIKQLKSNNPQWLNFFLLELCLVQVQSDNLALRDGRSLFVPELREMTSQLAIGKVRQQLDRQPVPTRGEFSGMSLTRLLQAPLKEAPLSLEAQLFYLRETWGELLPNEILTAIDSARALRQAELKSRGIPGPALRDAPGFGTSDEVVNFTPDRDWMPGTVLLAKAAYVWLHQLSERYYREINRLDQIPDEELDELQNFGFSGLWLIGIWQRSDASRRIKHHHGKHHVTASAYAIHDYRIADDLGGESALDNLKQRCLRRGIQLACDVVTNHTGIDSQWIRSHPDWFIQTDQPPYPGYRFSGSDLSGDDRLCIQIEDGYYDHSEAAVVFCRRDLHSGELRYIYHGNDGTHLPWNDTAQLNFLLPEVREAMINVILAAARRFGIIRFDAAMTLAKKHFQRLWYPLPGGGEGVPSRSAWAMENAEFNRLFPIEFWREVVDRIQTEHPDTLLVAEAFWLMEGYFVRTLGMHRVYNSAFMNMLKHEENARYRKTLREILVFEPAILQRFVNFMSNPDEDTAIEQFGNSDKYFCVATLLCTMPGLPLFAHGQLEGLREKYGMEYARPAWQEKADQRLVSEHWRQIAPLLQRRQLFSGSEAFQLYDFMTPQGVAESVYVYTNASAQGRVLVLCNNSPHPVRGWVGEPCPAKTTRVSHKEALNLDRKEGFYRCISLTGEQEFLRKAADPLAFELAPYDRVVLSRFEHLEDQDGRWQKLQGQIGLSPTPDLFARVELVDFWPTIELLHSALDLSHDLNDEELQGKLLQCLKQRPNANEPIEFLMEKVAITWFGTSLQIPSEGYHCLRKSLSQKLPPSSIIRQLFSREDLQKFFEIHDFEQKTYFKRESLEKLLLLLLSEIINSHNSQQNNINRFSYFIKKSIIKHRNILQLAAKTHYVLDDFLQVLTGEGLSELQRRTLTGAGAGYNPMKILFVASEAAPFAKTGGLADVVGSLPRALRQRGHDVRVIIPCYRSAQRNGFSLAKGRKALDVRVGGEIIRANLRQTIWEGVPFHFIEAPEYFDREYLYGTPEGDYQDNLRRFTFFNRAVLEYLLRADFRPDILHLHDWQASLIPALLATERAGDPFFEATASVLTIHNLGYQGIFPLEKVEKIGLPAEFTSTEHLEYFGNISLLKGGIVHADKINTVSETYCQEIQQEGLGHGFEGLLRSRSRDLSGILNGLNLKNWDPALDAALSKPFSSQNLNGKRSCKRALQKELGLAERHDLPLVAIISRLDKQKGVDLVEEIWPKLIQRELQFVLLGSGDQEQMAFWQGLQQENSDRFAIELQFDDKLSRRIYAAADCLLVPSRYEPCGLTQMIGLRYGAIPVVRQTGGLADTVFDIDQDPKSGNGFVFEQNTPDALLNALDRALKLYPQRNRWLHLVKKGMETDFGWDGSAQRYEDLYRQALEKKLNEF